MKFKESIENNSEDEQDARRLGKIQDEIVKLGNIGELKIEQIKELSDQLIEIYPNYSQEIEFLISVVYEMMDQAEYDHLKTKDGGRLESSVSRRLNTSFAESFYTQTNYLIQNQSNQEYLKKLFASCKNITDDFKVGRQWDRTYRGLIGQLAVYNLMEQNNLEPELASPKQDAFEKIDFWGKLAGKKLAVQGKISKMIKSVKCINTEEELDRLINEFSYNRIGREWAEKIRRDFIDCSKSHPEAQTMTIILPVSSINYSTGELEEEYFRDLSFKNKINLLTK